MLVAAKLKASLQRRRNSAAAAATRHAQLSPQARRAARQGGQVVNLKADEEERLAGIFKVLDSSGDGVFEPNDLQDACAEHAFVATFFNLELDPTLEDIATVFSVMDPRNNKCVSWEGFRVWYFKVIKEEANHALGKSLPPDPVWLGVGGQRLPERPLLRVSIDDLQEATLRGDAGLLRRLVEAGASVNAPLRRFGEGIYMTLLHVLACQPELPNGPRMVQEVLRLQGDVDAQTSAGASPLLLACAHGYLPCVEVLLRADALPDCMDDMGATPMHSALVKRVKSKELWEQASIETVRLLAAWRADPNIKGGKFDQPPIVQAVRDDSVSILQALLGVGARPEGFHEAVEAASVPVIRALAEAFANPFAEDRRGRTVMEIAMDRGNEEVMDTVRNLIGKLEREHHAHLQTRDAVSHSRFQTAAAPRLGQRRLSQLMRLHASEEKGLFTACKQRVQHRCRSIAGHKYFDTLSFGVLMMACFLPDMFNVAQVSDMDVRDYFVWLIFAFFALEVLLQWIGFGRKVLYSLYFWFDVFGCISVLLFDHSLIKTYTMIGNQTQDTSNMNSLMQKVGKLTRLIARAARLLKLVKLVRFLPGIRMKDSSQRQGVQDHIIRAISTRACLAVIFMCIAVPFVDFFTFPDEDYSMMAWAAMLEELAQQPQAPEALPEAIGRLAAFYEASEYFPIDVKVTLPNGTRLAFRLKADEPVLPKDFKDISDGGTLARFDFTAPNKSESIFDMALSAMIMLTVILAATAVNRSGSILEPLESLLLKVHTATKKAQTFLHMRPSVFLDGAHLHEVDDTPLEHDDDNDMVLIENVLDKLKALTELSLQKQASGAEGLGELGEQERSLVEAYIAQASPAHACASPAPRLESESEGASEIFAAERTVEHDRAIYAAVVVVSRSDGEALSPERLADWHLDLTRLSAVQKHAVCLNVFACNHGLEDGVQASLELYSTFIEEVNGGYGSSDKLPYHNWVHAVDVTSSLNHFFRVCSAHQYLTALERLSLVVAASAHDIGHGGKNNVFLMETASDLALRYNDTSPLEHMHASLLFDILRRESTALFATLSPKQFKQSRHLIIEAILHTDNAMHFRIACDLDIFVEGHAATLETSQDLFATNRAEWPSAKTVELLRDHDLQKLLRAYCVHFCDISNPMKTWSICQHWAEKIMEEFFMMGDLEKAMSLPVQQLNDRTKVNMPFSQIGFIDFFVLPLLRSTVKLLPPLAFAESATLDNVDRWFAEWANSSPPPSADERDKLHERVSRLKEASTVKQTQARVAMCQRARTGSKGKKASRATATRLVD